MTSHCREVVTLQVGHYANFVGSHWWNLQESLFEYSETADAQPKEVNHDVLFREGENLMGNVTYTPRLVCFDLKGSLSTLRQDGVLYDLPDALQETSGATWNSDVCLHKTDTVVKNDFLRDLEKQEEQYVEGTEEEEQLDDMESDIDSTETSPAHHAQPVFMSKLYNLDHTVEVWSDFLKVHLHPKTIHTINQFSHNSDTQPFDVFGYGDEVVRTRRFRDDTEDRLHFFLEECDNLQGLHILADAHDGFGGLACGLLEQLQEDYGNKGIMTFGLSPPKFEKSTPQQDVYRILNAVMSYEKMANHSSAFVPMSLATELWRKPGPPVAFPHLTYRNDIMYHTSAILAASLDTATLPYRLRSKPSLMSHITDALTPNGRKVLGLQSSLPLPLLAESNLVHSLMHLGDQLPWRPLTPMCFSHVQPFAQSVVMRGVPTARAICDRSPKIPRELSDCQGADEVLDLYLKDVCSEALNAGCSVQQKLKVAAPYPHIFNPEISQDGDVCNTARPPSQGVSEVAMMTSLQATTSCGTLLHSLHHHAARFDIKKFHKYLDCGLEEDDYKETLNGLQTLADNYQVNTEAIF